MTSFAEALEAQVLTWQKIPNIESETDTFVCVYCNHYIDTPNHEFGCKGEFELPPPRAELKWVGVDLDGTIAEPAWTPENPTSEIGAPIERNVIKLHKVIQAGFKVHIHTSRPWTDYEAVEKWLLHHRIPFHAIQMGKPLFYRYVDDRAINAEAESWLT